MTSPKVWGKHFWYTFHIVALAYPERPTREDMQVYKEFYINFGKVLPCKKCTQHYSQHLLQLPVSNSLGSRKDLFAWTVQFHNIVNQWTGKAIWNTEYAEEYYRNGDYDNCVSCGSETTWEWKLLLLIMIVINLIAVGIIIRKTMKSK